MKASLVMPWMSFRWPRDKRTRPKCSPSRNENGLDGAGLEGSDQIRDVIHDSIDERRNRMLCEVGHGQGDNEIVNRLFVAVVGSSHASHADFGRITGIRS